MLPLRPLLVATCLGCLLHAGDPPPQIPDDLGLGPRLALLDYLRSEWKLKTPDQATYQELCAIYWAEHRRRNPAPAPSEEQDAEGRERVRVLASKLLQRGLSVPAQADEAKLQALLDQHERNKAAPTERSEQPAPAEAVKPADEAKPAAGGGTAVPTDWKGRLAALWKAREEQIPADPPLIWAAELPETAHVTNRYRLRRAGGEFTYDDRPGPPEDGLEVWINVTRLEPSGFGTMVPRFQNDRWLPAWWDAPARAWTTYQPAQQAWIRDSQASQLIFAAILDGPQGKGERSAAWRRLHAAVEIKAALASGDLGGEMTRLFAEVADAHNVDLPLAAIEIETIRHEQDYKRLAGFEETLIAAQNAAKDDAGKEAVKNALHQLNVLGTQLNVAMAARREHLRTALSRIGVLP